MLLYCRGIVTFFFIKNNTNLIVPHEWHEFDDKQLRYLFVLFDDDYSLAEIRTLCLWGSSRESEGIDLNFIQCDVLHLPSPLCRGATEETVVSEERG